MGRSFYLYASEGQVVPPSMKVIVCADSHGAFAAAERLLEQNREAAAVIFLGDGAEEWEDLCAIYPQMPFYPVRGNCDWGSDWPAVRVVELGGHRLFCTHGHLYGVKSGDMGPLLRAAKAENCDIVLYGHTHAARIEYREGRHLLNPVSLRHPAEGRPGYIELVLDGKNVVPIPVELK